MNIPADLMRRLAEAAAKQTLPRFRQAGEVANKLAGGFDPVTEADREAERVIRDILRESFPDHGILGEEWGGENLDSPHVWVIDPIDGTRSFISGMPLWGTLIGLLEDGRAVQGMMSQPFTKELFFTEGDEARYEGPDGSRPMRTRQTTSLFEATLCTTTPALFKEGEREAYDALERSVRLARYGTDCYAYAMLAAGQIDLVTEAGLQPYDIVALIPLVEKAGGRITGWKGERVEGGGRVLAAATPELHSAALEFLQNV